MPRSRPAPKSRPRSAAKRKPARRGKALRTSASKRAGGVDTSAWFAGKSFSFDWTSWHFPNWIKLLEPYRGRSLRVLEIGSWEGRSALFFLNHLPRARLTCIDSFEGGKEHRATPDSQAFLKRVEKWFDANTAPFKKRVEKIKAHSAPALAELGIRRRQFDVAYIDGSHVAADVYSDAVLTWPLIARGGLVIFDDYQWKEDPEPLHNPKPGIDAFLKAIEGQYRVVHRSYQVAIVKR